MKRQRLADNLNLKYDISKMNKTTVTMYQACTWCGSDCYVYYNDSMTIRVYKCIECGIEIPRHPLYLTNMQNNSNVLGKKNKGLKRPQ